MISVHAVVAAAWLLFCSGHWFQLRLNVIYGRLLKTSTSIAAYHTSRHADENNKSNATVRLNIRYAQFYHSLFPAAIKPVFSLHSVVRTTIKVNGKG